MLHDSGSAVLQTSCLCRVEQIAQISGSIFPELLSRKSPRVVSKKNDFHRTCELSLFITNTVEPPPATTLNDHLPKTPEMLSVEALY